MTGGRWQVPDGWEWVRSETIADIVGGGTPRADDESNFSTGGIPWITPADLTGYKSAYIGRGRRDLSEKGIKGSGATLLPAGTVLFSSRAPVGYCAIAANAISTNQGFKSLVLKDEISSEYIRYYLLSAKEYAESLASGTTFLELSAKRMSELKIPLPPLPEQRRIVRKLDTLSARTTTARTHLTTIGKLVERYKLAVLATLTLSAEQENPDWKAVTLEQVRDPKASIRYGVVQPGTIKDQGVPLVRVCDLLGGRIQWNELRRVSAEIDEAYAKARIRDGDILVSVVGTIGRVALVAGVTERTNIARAVSRIRPNRTLVEPNWLFWRLNAPDTQTRFDGDVREVARKTLNISLIKETPFKLPPIEAQREIVRRIETAFTKIDCLAAEAAKALKLLGHLDQRILAKAFAGELVPQDPTDEPAEALLARIREARAATPRARCGRKASA